jgi:nitrogen fixation/metabolism regulation signal transduction histidine kinase
MASQRKKYLIDRKFQLKTTFSLIGFVAVIFALLIAMAGVNLLDVNKRIMNMVEINKAIADTISAPSPQISKEEYASYMLLQTTLEENKKNVDSMINFNMLLIAIIIAVVILQSAVLFYILIRQTHRIAGPIYVMTNYMKQIRDGKIPESLRKLRKKDFFQDTYQVFGEMVDSIRKK